jgi:hypothetical protein
VEGFCCSETNPSFRHAHGGRAGRDQPDPPACIAVENRAGQEERGSDGEKGDGRRVQVTWIIVFVVLGPPKPLDGSIFRRQLSYEYLASRSVNGGSDDGEGSGFGTLQGRRPPQPW